VWFSKGSSGRACEYSNDITMDLYDVGLMDVDTDLCGSA
jgi:hypothetical protein